MVIYFPGIGKHVAVQPPAALGQNETLRVVQAAQYYPALLSVMSLRRLLDITKDFMLLEISSKLISL